MLRYFLFETSIFRANCLKEFKPIQGGWKRFFSRKFVLQHSVTVNSFKTVIYKVMSHAVCAGTLVQVFL